MTPVSFMVAKEILNLISSFNSHIFAETYKIFSVMSNNVKYNFFDTPQYMLFCNILENVRMDLCYLNSLADVQFDIFNFSGVYRNIRNSSEAYYDLYNLHADPEYSLLLQYKYKVIKNKPNFVGKNSDIYRKLCSDFQYLSITEKAKIALGNGFKEDVMERYKDICKEANSKVHPNPFPQICTLAEKSEILRSLLMTDCEILFSSFVLFVNFNNSFVYNFGNYYNINQEQNYFSDLKYAILNHPILISVPNVPMYQ